MSINPKKTVINQQCDVCSEVYNNANDLHQHRRDVCCRKNYLCSNCPRYFRKKDDFEHHVKKFHNTPRVSNVFKCARDGCMFITANAQLMKTHLQQAHPDAKEIQDYDDVPYIYMCPHWWCYKRFDSRVSVEAHQKQCSEVEIKHGFCHICNNMTLTSEVWIGCEDGPVVCSECLESQPEEESEDEAETINDNGLKVATENSSRKGKEFGEKQRWGWAQADKLSTFNVPTSSTPPQPIYTEKETGGDFGNELEKTATYSNEEMREISQSESEKMTSLPSSPCDEFMGNIRLLCVQNQGESTALISVSPSPTPLSPPAPIILSVVSLAENSSAINSLWYPSRSETSDPPSPLPINNSSNSPPSDRSSSLPISNLTLPQTETASASRPPHILPQHSHSKLLSNYSSGITSMLILEQDTVSSHSSPPNLHSLQNLGPPEANAFKSVSVTTQGFSPQPSSAVLYPHYPPLEQSLSVEPQNPLPLPDFLEKLGLQCSSLPLFTRKRKIANINTSPQTKKRKRSKQRNFTKRKRSVKLVSKLSKIPLKLSLSKTLSKQLTSPSTKISTLSESTLSQRENLPTSATRRSPLEKTPPAKPCLKFLQAPPVSNDLSRPIEKPLSPLHLIDKTLVQINSLPQTVISPISTLAQKKIGDSSVLSLPPKAVVIGPIVSGNAVSVEGIDNVPLSGQSTSNSDAAVNEDALKGFVNAFSEKGLTALLAILNGDVEEYPF